MNIRERFSAILFTAGLMVMAASWARGGLSDVRPLPPLPVPKQVMVAKPLTPSPAPAICQYTGPRVVEATLTKQHPAVLVTGPQYAACPASASSTAVTYTAY